MDVLPPWDTYFFSVVQHDGVGTGAVIISTEKNISTYSFNLTPLLSSSMAKYKALILSVSMGIENGMKEHDVYDDS